MADHFKSALPQVKFNKNGYEIRTQVLEMAKSYTEFEHSMKFSGWEQTVKRDPETGEVVTTVTNASGSRCIDAVLEAAEKFYSFVNGNK